MSSLLLTDMEEWLNQKEKKVHGNYINGEWLESNSDQIFSIYNSAKKSEKLASFQDSNEWDVNQAVEAAAEAFKSWSRLPGPERGGIIYRFAELLEENAEELAYMLSAEQGKALAEAKGEVQRAAKEARFGAGEAFRIEGSTLPGERENVWSSTVRKPLGVVAAIAPWNFPVVTPIRKIIPALAYGCTVVYKPASVTPWTSILLMELLGKAGVPKGVVNLVVGSGTKVGNPLVNHPLVRGISFTGSSKLGIQINEIAAKRLARTQLELGGKNPAVVLDYDSAEDTAKQIVSAAFACSGQRCTSISRVVVTKEKKEEITAAVIEEMKKTKVGPAWEEGVTMGPLINEEHVRSVCEYLEIGREEGARLLYGGDVLTEGQYTEGAYMVPALLDQVTPEMRIAREEIFGPMLIIIEVENQEEAFKVANNVDYGLAASIFTKDLSTAYRFADESETGMVHVNHGTASAAHVPFGGIKQSGAGPFSIGKSNVEFFTEMKAVYFQF